MLNPVAMSIIRTTFEDPRERAQAIGIWGAVVGISLAMGPVLGGNLLDVRFATEPGSGSAAIAVLAVATLVACLWAAGKLPRPRGAS